MQTGEHYHIGRIKKIEEKSISLAANSIYSKIKTFSVKDINGLSLGDFVLINAEGEVHALWRTNNKDNIIFATNVCNEFCRFCPQPREGDVYSNDSINKFLISSLHRNDITFVTITGGEPTILGTGLSDLIFALIKKNPKCSIAILSNGMEFDNESYARDIVKVGKSQTRFCIAIHSDAPSIHDSITGVIGSFDRTALGILNLQRFNAEIEIRVVLNRLNTERLQNIATSISMNFPFVNHVAFMGLEMHSNAAENAEAVWINPPDYMKDLSSALYILKCRNIPASIYNLPYCLVLPALWPYLRDSISSWKKTYLPICESCSKKLSCPGLFGTSAFQSPSIISYKY